MKNRKEFIDLVEKYEKITLDEVKKAWDITPPQFEEHGMSAAKNLTGFGTSSTCPLCIAVGNECRDCVYEHSFGCIDDGDNYKTYHDIEFAKTPSQLRNAIRRRAKLLRKKYKHILE